jgi:hypothetical protein
MAKKELVVKFLVWWIVITGLLSGLYYLILSVPGAQPIMEPEVYPVVAGVSIAAIICLSGKCKTWLEE